MYLSGPSSDQVHSALHVARSGTATEPASRPHVASSLEVERNQRAFSSLDLEALREHQELQAEVRRLKRLVADLTADKRTLCEALARTW